jgi:uncharacterized protein YlxW (UPF0749 family)
MCLTKALHMVLISALLHHGPFLTTRSFLPALPCTAPRRTQHAEVHQQLEAAQQQVTDLQHQLQERQQECAAVGSSSREQATATALLQQQVCTTL